MYDCRTYSWMCAMRLLKWCFVACIGAIFAVACAKRVPEPPTVRQDQPHVSWQIRSGPTGDENTVCQSDTPTNCLLAATTAQRRSMATIHLYLHPTLVDTTYRGTMSVGFFDEATPGAHQTNVNTTVKANGSPGNVSVTGIVSPRPGTYRLTVSLRAQSGVDQTGQNVREEVQVRVQ